MQNEPDIAERFHTWDARTVEKDDKREVACLVGVTRGEEEDNEFRGPKNGHRPLHPRGDRPGKGPRNDKRKEQHGRKGPKKGHGRWITH